MASKVAAHEAPMSEGGACSFLPFFRLSVLFARSFAAVCCLCSFFGESLAASKPKRKGGSRDLFITARWA